jgi:hypothetical protein
LNWLRGIAIFMAVVQFWTLRYTVMSDGISYLDIARNYSAGNWRKAVNASWSPLFSWLLAPVLWALGPDRRNDLIALHTLNLLVYFVALFLFDRFVRELGDSLRWNSAEARKVYTLCAYFAFYWVELHAVQVELSSPDVLVLALVLFLALLLFRIRTHRFAWGSLALFGTMLGLAYLAKTAMLTVAPVYIGAAVLPFRRNRSTIRRVSCICLPLLALALPWVVALRLTKGYWTAGDSGKLNFAWEMCGAARWVHWQGEPGNIGKPLHPTREVMKSPAVYEFNGPIAEASTYAPWYDPAYYYAGVKPSLRAITRDGWLNLARNARYLGWLIILAPGLGPALLFLPFVLRKGREWSQGFRNLLAIAFPAAAVLPLYVAVFVDRRYVGGQIFVLAVLSLAAALSVVQEKWHRDLCYLASLASCLAFVLLPCLTVLVLLGRDFGQISSTGWDQHRAIAKEVHAAGLKSGDKIGYIGLSVRAYWPSLAGLHIVSDIPVGAIRSGGELYNQDADDPAAVNLFWRSSPGDRDRVLAGFKRAGATAVIADWIVPGADTRGWIRLHSCFGWRQGSAPGAVFKHEVYVRFL